MDYVEDCGYDNLSLSRVMVRVFSLKSTHFNMWVMWVYIVWVETWCIKYKKNSKIKCFTGISREGLTSKILVKTSCHHLS